MVTALETGQCILRLCELAATRENRSLVFPTRSDINRSVQSQKVARRLNFWI